MSLESRKGTCVEFGSARALMHIPSAVSDRLMLLASLALSPAAFASTLAQGSVCACTQGLGAVNSRLMLLASLSPSPAAFEKQSGLHLGAVRMLMHIPSALMTILSNGLVSSQSCNNERSTAKLSKSGICFLARRQAWHRGSSEHSKMHQGAAHIHTLQAGANHELCLCPTSRGPSSRWHPLLSCCQGPECGCGLHTSLPCCRLGHEDACATAAKVRRQPALAQSYDIAVPTRWRTIQSVSCSWQLGCLGKAVLRERSAACGF